MLILNQTILPMPQKSQVNEKCETDSPQFVVARTVFLQIPNPVQNTIKLVTPLPFVKLICESREKQSDQLIRSPYPGHQRLGP